MPSPTAEQVLVVDDDPEIRQTVRAILEDEGYTVLEAPDGLQGLALLAQNDQCLVALVDYRMPQMNGFELLRSATADEGDKSCRAYVLFTANPDLMSPAMKQFLDAKRIPLMTKPFDIDTLLMTIEQAREHLARQGA